MFWAGIHWLSGCTVLNWTPFPCLREQLCLWSRTHKVLTHCSFGFRSYAIIMTFHHAQGPGVRLFRKTPRVEEQQQQLNTHKYHKTPGCLLCGSYSSHILSAMVFPWRQTIILTSQMRKLS